MNSPENKKHFEDIAFEYMDSLYNDMFEQNSVAERADYRPEGINRVVDSE